MVGRASPVAASILSQADSACVSPARCRTLAAPRQAERGGWERQPLLFWRPFVPSPTRAASRHSSRSLASARAPSVQKIILQRLLAPAGVVILLSGSFSPLLFFFSDKNNTVTKPPQLANYLLRAEESSSWKGPSWWATYISRALVKLRKRSFGPPLGTGERAPAGSGGAKAANNHNLLTS